MYNANVMKDGKGSVIAYRRPTTEAKASTYVHCKYCCGFLKRTLLWKHNDKCPNRPPEEEDRAITGKRRVLTIASFAEPTSSNEAPFWKIANRMRDDDIAQIVKQDNVLRAFGVHIINKSNSKLSDQSKHVSQKLRDLARLVKETGNHSCFKSTCDM